GVQKHLEEESYKELITAEEEQLFSVTALGPVGHVYLAQPMSLDEKRALAQWLVVEGRIAGVLLLVASGQIDWGHSRGTCHLPDEAKDFLPHPPARRGEIAHDLITVCEQKYAGDMVLLGWSPDGQPWTFPLERGAHGGPGVNETAGFALLPAKTRLP